MFLIGEKIILKMRGERFKRVVAFKGFDSGDDGGFLNCEETDEGFSHSICFALGDILCAETKNTRANGAEETPGVDVAC